MTPEVVERCHRMLENGRGEWTEEANCQSAVFGVSAYIINDTRFGEFDDCLVM